MKPLRANGYFLVAAGANNMGLWCKRKIILSWIADGGKSTATHCRSLMES
jgi:hypothetical protein